jgi:hypothetical protein
MSSTRHNAPESVPTTTSDSEMLMALVKVLSANVPKTQFLPVSAFGDVELGACSAFERDLDGDTGLTSESLQILTCLTPTLESVSAYNAS